MADESGETPFASDTELDGQGAAPKQQADAHQAQHTTPVATGPGEGNDVPSALGQEPEDLDHEGHIAALMDVADRAFQYADEAANRAQRAAARASLRNEERLEAVMHAAHAHWLDAERHHGGARQAHADGEKSRLEYHASQVISAAVETQRAAGVSTTADALQEVLEGLKPATERARQAAAREQLEAELAELNAERDRELTAVTRMDAANRERLQHARWRAESAVPELGWWPALAADMAHAYQGRLWLDETGTPRLLKKTADDRAPAGRKVNAERVAMLRAAGFLVTRTDSATSTPLRPSDMGREALYLATLYPEGLHADERAAYEARYQASRRPRMNNEDRKSAARRLPPLDPYTIRAVREKPVLLEDDHLPQISTEDVARDADMEELAQRLWRWAAMSHGERPDVIPSPGTAGVQKPEALAGELGRDVGGERAAAASSSEPSPAQAQNVPLAGTASSTTPPDGASEDTSGLPAADVTPTQPLTQEPGEEPVEPEGWSADAPSALAEASSVASWHDDEAPAALLETPGTQDDPATATATPQPNVREQTELFSVPTPAPTPTQEGTATEATAAEPEAELPRFSQARKQILDEIVRGNISEVDGRFMQRVPRRSERPVGSPQRIIAVLDEGLAERTGEQIQLTERGFAWYAHHKCPLPAVPRDVATVEQAPLPPIDYAPLHALPTIEESGEAPQPPAPVPLPDDWYRSGGRPSEESIRGAYAMGAEAAERAARSTARDVASMAAGPDHRSWTHQHPLAQYDENAAAALESLADPVTLTYAARAVRNLRGALEEAGKEAADHYVQNVRSPQWKTGEGSQSDDVHRDRVRGIVITYCLAVRDHATAYGLDTYSIVNVLEDAAGWTGRFRPLGNKAVEYPYLPAAENVAEAAQYVANALRLYALGRTDMVDASADRRSTWRTVEPRPVPAPPTAVEEAERHSADVASAASAGAQDDPAAAPAPAQAGDDAPRGPAAVGPQAPGADGAPAEASPSADGAPGAESATPAPTAADDTTRMQQGDRQGPDQDQGQERGEQARSGAGERAVEAPQQMSREDDGPRILPAASAVPITAEGATSVAAPGEPIPAVPGLRDGDSEPADGGLGAPVPPAEAAPAPTGPAEDRQETSTGPDIRAAKVAADGNRPQNALPVSQIRPQPRPADVREEGTVATSAPPSAASAEEPAAPNQTIPRAPQLAPETAAPYPDAGAYAAAHEALLAELDQHEQWLVLTPVAAEAATTLADTGDLGVPGLAALLALQAALGESPDEDGRRAHLAQRLGHHLRCGQMTMAKIFFARAARTSSTDVLRDLYERAAEGRFLAFGQQTEDGRLELGQYIPVRAQQITQQSDGAEDPTEPTPQAAQEATTMAADPDDEIQLPVLELSGEVPRLTAEEAAPRLLARAQTHLAGGRPAVEAFAHIHGRPVYAMVPPGEPPALYLGLTPPDTDGDTRAVSISEDELAAVTAETLLTAVTGWLNGNDTGARPLLDYASGTPTPTPDTAEQEHPAPAPTHSPAPAATPAEPTRANDTVANPGTPLASAPGAPAEGPAAEATPAATPPVPEPAPAQPSDHEAQAAPPARAAAASAPEDSSPNTEADEQARAEDTSQETIAAPAADPNHAAQADPVAQITALVRTALSDGGVTLDATAVLTAPRTVTITLETSGTPERDRELADMLRTALNNSLRQHPEQQLAAYRIDFEHTSQPGQGSLPESTSTTVVPVPRDRLIAATNAAAKIFAERLHSDPNAELARTYLTQEREFPAEVQQKWGLGYAPSDRRAKPKRWDILCQELTAQGFTEDELLQAGLARRSSRGTLIDYFDDRIMFPIHDENREIVGFTGRRIDRPGETEEQAEERQNKKYYNTSNDAVLFSKGDLVFGLYHPAQTEALAGSSGPRVSVEGPTDVLAVAEASATLPLEQRPVVGAPMGTAFTERQLTVLRGLDTDNPRPHIAFLDADDSGRKVLLDKWNLLVRAAGPTTVTTAPDAKDAAKLWKEGIKADGDGAAPVLRALEQGKPLLDAAVEAVLLKHADESERANHAFDSIKDFPRSRFIAAEAARYIHQAVQVQAPGDTAALEQAALTWAKRLDQEWGIRGFMTATAVLLGPGEHHEDHENEVYEQALDLLAADPEGYFANDSHVRSRQSASEARAMTASGAEAAAARRPGQWPAGTRASGPMASTSEPAGEPAPKSGELVLSMVLPSPVDGQPVEHTDRTTAAYALHTAVHERLGQHTTESPEPDRLPQPLKLGTVYGVDLSTSGDDQTSEDPTVVVWLGSARSDSLRMSYSRFVAMTGPELLAAIEWRAAQAAGRLGAPLSPTWRTAVRSILPPQFPAQPTPAQLADLLDTIAQGPDGTKNRIRRRAEQAVALYTAGHPDLALNVLAADDHIWVLGNDGSWIQEEAVDTELSWEELDNGFSQEAAELENIAQAATALPPADGTPMAADLTVAHHSAHEALAALRPYSIGLPGTLYEKITDLVAQMDAGEPAMRRLHGPGGEQLMNRAKTSFVRILEGLATVASKIRLTGLSNRLERTVARLRGQDLDTLPTPRAVRGDRRMQDLAHIERDLERRMASPTTALGERGELQEQWIINRARWRARYEQLHGQPPGTDFLPDNGLVAGAPPVPNLIAAHDLLLDRLAARVAELRDTDPHTGEDANPYEPTADLLNGVAWAYQQRLIGIVPTGDDPQGPIPPAQLRQAALMVTSHQNASPLTLRRTMNVTAERADRLLHRLEEQQILGPYRADAPRTVLARTADIDTLLARPVTPPSPRTPPAAPAPAPTAKSPAADAAEPKGADADELDTARIQEIVNKILADKQTRSETHGEPDPADGAAPAPRVRKNLRKTAHTEAEDNALAAGQSTSLAQSQS
ncbi:DNA translocase FtsK [Streptomyces sp. NPDC050988]|uniref:DNA translocase FtsK n=1 Tax=Streptomyces sp. NPDC050988 TaxID=3365637 RepID=UPI0037BC0E59